MVGYIGVKDNIKIWLFYFFRESINSEKRVIVTKILEFLDTRFKIFIKLWR